MAGREKDRAFAAAGLVERALLLARVEALALEPDRRELVRRLVP